MLIVKDVYKKFNSEAGFFAKIGKFIYVINGISFEIREGETYGLVGESGCGKTTMARLLVQVYKHDAGNIKYISADGNIFQLEKITKSKLRLLRSKIKYIFQDPAKSLNPRMNILEILTSGYKYSPHYRDIKSAKEEAEQILQRVGLTVNDLSRRPADFSGGQRQRISIARALIQKPDFLICDEVVSALDVSIQSQILNLLLKIKEESKIKMLFIAHDIAVVSFFSDRIGVMYGGVIVEEARSMELIKHRMHPYTKHLYLSMPGLSGITAANKPLLDEIKDITVKPQGCLFYPRCSIRENECREEKPDLREISKDHFVACRLV
ncbi:MAG: ABC transporter ATP-binding protein [Desulfobacteraceae bacterium]|nr:MAG: ABC transporter ATP-binding protein [Desulfobacteraceae bacterium]